MPDNNIYYDPYNTGQNPTDNSIQLGQPLTLPYPSPLMNGFPSQPPVYDDVTAPAVQGTDGSVKSDEVVGNGAQPQNNSQYAYNPFNMYGNSYPVFGGTPEYYNYMLGKSIGFKPQQITNPNVTDAEKNKLQGMNIARGVFAGLGSGLSMAKSALAGAGEAKRRQHVVDDYTTDQRNAQVNAYNPYGQQQMFGNNYQQYFGIGFKNGGKASIEEILSGRLAVGVNPATGTFNAEVEDGEYLILPDGTVVGVAGKKHSQGGEKMQLEDETKVISDNVLVTPEHKKLFKTFGIKPNKKMTYADLMDKVNRDIGMDKLNSEQEDVFKMVEKNNSVSHENTKNKNLEYLSKNINDIENQKKGLAPIQNFFADLTFQKQEIAKKKKDTKTKDNTEISEFDGDVLTVEEGKQIPIFAQDGGYFTDTPENNVMFQKWAKNKGFQSMEDVKNYFEQVRANGSEKSKGRKGNVKEPIQTPTIAFGFKQGGEKKVSKYDDGGTVYSQRVLDDGTIEIIDVEGDEPRILSRRDFIMEFDNEQYTNLLKFKTVLNQNPVNTDELSPRVLQGQNESGAFGNVKTEDDIKDRLEGLTKQFPVLAKNAFKIERDDDGNITSFDMSDANVKNFQEGVNKVLDGNLGLATSLGMSDEEIKEIQDFVSNENFVADDPNNEFTARLFDSKFGNFTSSRQNLAFDLLTPEDLTKVQELGITSYKELLNDDGTVRDDLGLSKLSTDKLAKVPADFEGNFLLNDFTPNLEVETIEGVPTPSFDPLEKNATPAGGGVRTMMNQDGLPPDPLQGHFFNIPQMGQISPIKVSPETALRENARVGNATREIIGQNVGAQQGANIANTIGQQFEANNKIVAQTNAQNAQYAQQANQINLQQDNAQQQATDAALARHDQLQLTALNKTNNDIRNYYDHLISNRVNATREARNLNILDAMSPQFTFDQTGNVMFTPEYEQGLTLIDNPVAAPIWNGTADKSQWLYDPITGNKIKQ